METREALDVLVGGAPADVVECTMALGAEMLILGGAATSEAEARAKLAAAIKSGAAARRAERMIEAQGGNPAVVTDRDLLEVAREEVVVEATRDGYVERVDTLAIGLTAVAMGAGRTRADQEVDPGVGIYVLAKPGMKVGRGEPLARVRLRSRKSAGEIAERVGSAFFVGDVKPPERRMVLGRVG
jgi:thymidine phosphorylase